MFIHILVVSTFRFIFRAILSFNFFLLSFSWITNLCVDFFGLGLPRKISYCLSLWFSYIIPFLCSFIFPIIFSWQSFCQLFCNHKIYFFHLFLLCLKFMFKERNSIIFFFNNSVLLCIWALIESFYFISLFLELFFKR